MRSRVLWISHVIPYPPVAGVLLRAFNLVKAIGIRHELTLVAFTQESWLRTCFGDVEHGLAACRRELERHCVSVIFLPIERQRRLAGKLRTAFESMVTTGGYMKGWLQGPDSHRLFRSFGEESFDLVHFDTISLAPFRRHFKVTPSTLGHHNIESHMLSRRAANERNPVKKLYFWQEGRRLRMYERRVCKQFTVNITCSDLDSERLLAISPSAKVRAVPNGVDCNYFQPSAGPPNLKSLVFVGTLNWYPNTDAVMFLLHNVWPRLKALRRELTLDIVGSNPPRTLIEMARSLTGVTVHGFVPDIRPIVNSAALFICPIRDGGGTKLKVLDAFAMQKCVVAHPIACEGIDVTAGVNVVFAVEPSEWVRQIDGLLNDGTRRTEIGVAARHLAKTRYSFEAIGRDLAELFADLSSQGKSSPRAST